MGKKVSEMTPEQRANKKKTQSIYNAKVSLETKNNRTITYRIFGRDISLPKGFTFGAGVRLGQNKTSVEEGFKKLEKFLANPTTDNWSKLFGSKSQFGTQLRNYLAEGDRAPSLKKDIKGAAASKKLFDALKVKELIKPEDIGIKVFDALAFILEALPRSSVTVLIVSMSLGPIISLTFMVSKSFFDVAAPLISFFKDGALSPSAR